MLVACYVLSHYLGILVQLISQIDDETNEGQKPDRTKNTEKKYRYMKRHHKIRRQRVRLPYLIYFP